MLLWETQVSYRTKRCRRSLSGEEFKIANIRIPPALVADIDNEVAVCGHISRSEFILASVRCLDHISYQEELMTQMYERSMMREFPCLRKRNYAGQSDREVVECQRIPSHRLDM